MPIPSFDLTGKTALITGGSRGIGFAIAEAFVAHGATVAVAARTASQVEEAASQLSVAGRSTFGLTVDVEDPAATERLARDAVAALGHVDILVNNAGMGQGGRAAVDVDNAFFDQIMAVNFRGPFVLSREIGRHMIERGQGGRIINVTSIDGLRAYPNGVIYSASKGALELLTKSLAAEWAKHGILVNSIAPGWVRTDMTRRIFGQPLEQQVLDHTLTHTVGEPVDMAGMALFLASEAGRFTTAATMVLDGGYVHG